MTNWMNGVLLKHNFVQHSMYQYRRGKDRVYIGTVPGDNWALTLSINNTNKNFYNEQSLDEYLKQYDRETKLKRILK